MKTNHQQNEVVRWYGLILWVLFLALSFVSLTASAQLGLTKPDKSTFNPLVRKVQQIYTSQIGVRESPSNAGPEVEKYLRYVKLPKGNPWCAAFVCWVFGRAGIENPRSGWSPDLFSASKLIWERGKITGKKFSLEPGIRNKEPTCLPARQGFPPKVPFDYPSRLASGKLPSGQAGRQLATPETSDVFGIYFQEKKRIAHVGFIDQWDGKWLITVEGNTNLSGSREGDGVYRKRRLLSSINKVARYISLSGKEGS